MGIDIQETILIVTGSELTPEEKDRPLAYKLKETIDAKGSNPYQKAVVVSDRWYLDNEMFQICPSILVGGPGVNAATANFHKEMALVWTDRENAFIQAKEHERVALWGMNQAGTEMALDRFVAGAYLDAMLLRHWQA